MTKIEAIEYLEKNIKLHELFNETKHQHKAIEALNMAIKTLQHEKERREDIYECPNCIGEVHKNYIYCPFCGIKVDEGITMNTHEAIKILRNTAWLGTNEDREKTEQAIEVVAEALQQEPKMVHQETLEQVMWERDIAIEQLKELGYGLGEKIRTDEALEQESSCRNTRQVDLISRQDAIKEISDEFENEWEEADVNFNHGLNMALSIIKALNSAEPKHGKWVDKGDFYVCSECGERMPYAVLGSKLSRAYAFMADYCPNCGARMESDEE